MDRRCPRLGFAADLWSEFKQRTITFSALSLTLLVLTACGADSKYFYDGVNESMQDPVGKRYGVPHKVQASADDGETWTYFERGSGATSFSGQVRGGGC
ncbi:MAG: hypothetical protein OJF47_002032 [Nitrospira sp.]|jgi:hypothetical protein|nr:MAG: hypothetical protein OJF47_002032 [Nitrospira sp.]